MRFYQILSIGEDIYVITFLLLSFNTCCHGDHGDTEDMTTVMFYLSPETKPIQRKPSTTLKGDIETVRVRLSVHPSVRNEIPLTATVFHRFLTNLYSMFVVS